MECSIKDCDRKVFARGLCQTHYKRLKNGMSLNAPIQRQYHGIDGIERFSKRYIVNPSTGCWEWSASTNTGYGQMRLFGSLILAHRASWLLHFGDPADQVVCHKCDNPICVNPQHLFLGQQADNVADMHAKGRARKRGLKGEAHNLAKLTADIVRQIRASPLTDRELAEAYGVTRATVFDVRRGKTWKHIE